jgi:hypothetical protein
MCSSLEKGMQRMIMCHAVIRTQMSLSKWSTRDPNLTVVRRVQRLNIDPLEVPIKIIVNEEDKHHIKILILN